MVFDLCVVNWTAIGVIATAGAVIVALLANYKTNKNNEKNRRLQIALLRQQRDQKKLDEMVQNVMQLSRNLNSFDMMHYSSKFKDDTFTVEDRRALEHLTEECAAKATKLSLQMEMLRNHDSAKPMLDYFWEIWKDYGLWSISITTLFQCMSTSQEMQQEEDNTVLTEEIVSNMRAKLLEIDAHYSAAFEGLLKNKDNPMSQAQAIMELFGIEMAQIIQRKCEILSKKVIDFIRVEQKRIDDMVE